MAILVTTRTMVPVLLMIKVIFNVSGPMKKIFIPFFVSAIAVTTFISCAKETPSVFDNEEKQAEVKDVTNDVHIITDKSIETKTFLADDGASGYISKWHDSDQIGLFQIYEKAGATEYADKVLSSATSLSDSDQKADFTVALTDVDGGSNYKYVAVYPASAATRNSGDLDLVIPATQTFGTTSFDKDADILVSERVDRAAYSSDALQMGFARVGTIVKLTLKGLKVGETVSKVTLSTTEEDKYLAGTVKYDIAGKSLKSGITSGSQTLTLNAPSSTVVPAGGNLTVWFRCAEVELTEDLTVTVKTTNFEYFKTIDLASAGKTINFQSGRLATFSVGSMNAVLYSESFGSTTTNTEISDYTGWSWTGTLRPSGTWRISKNNLTDTYISTDKYEGASGLSHLFSGSSDYSATIVFGDVSAYTNVQLTFGWANNAGKNKDRTMKVEVSSNGGSDWSSITYTTSANAKTNDGFHLATYNLTDANKANFAVRFTNTASHTSRIDDVKLVGSF